MDEDVPLGLVKWLRGFLLNRQARVHFNGVDSRSRDMRQGLPQGSVLSPVLFLFYINELARKLPNSNLNALFADDVSVLATRRSLEEAEAATQQSVDMVVSWAKEAKLRLNAGKSEAATFTTKSNEAGWKPKIEVEGEAISHVSTPRLLGVILDRNLFFGPHVDTVTNRMATKTKIIAAVANTEWGWRKQYLVRLYTAFIDSIWKYAGFAWLASAAKSHILRLERAQNRALRMVTGQHMATPVEALRQECGLPGIDTEIKRILAKSAEKAVRLTDDHPRKIAFSSGVRQTIKRKNWRAEATRLQQLLPQEITPRVDIRNYDTEPWLEAKCLQVCPELEGVVSRLDRDEIKREAAMRRIRQVAADRVIYTDGSAMSGIRWGGNAVVVTRGDPEEPDVLDTILNRGSLFTCSYEEEVAAMGTAVQWVRDHCDRNWSVLICTDSQSLCMALRSFNQETEIIRVALKDHIGTVTIQWIPGHSDIPGNERADKAAKEATGLNVATRPVSFRSACMQIRRTFEDDLTHQRTREIYSAYNKEREEQIQSRKDQVLLAQLRSGKHMALMEYRHMLDESVSELCPRCQESEHTLEHWLLKCPATLAAKVEIFGTGEIGLNILTKEPRKAIALARRTLLGDSPPVEGARDGRAAH